MHLPCITLLSYALINPPNISLFNEMCFLPCHHLFCINTISHQKHIHFYSHYARPTKTLNKNKFSLRLTNLEISAVFFFAFSIPFSELGVV